MPKTMHSAIAIVIGAAAVALAGCSSGTPETSGAPPSSVDASIDGTYRYTLTRTEAEAADWRGEADLATLPWTMTIILDDGTYQLSWRTTDDAASDPVGRFRLDGEELVIDGLDGDEIPVHMEFTYSILPDGGLELTPAPGMSPDDAFVFTSSQWERID